MHPGTYSAWYNDLRMRKSLGLVCKAWRPIGLALLYETIAILRMGQLRALFDDLTSDSSRGKLELIKCLNISFIVPNGHHLEDIFDWLEFIIMSCPRLASITFGTATPWITHENHDNGDPTSYLTRFNTPRSLRVMSTAGQLVHLLRCCMQLTSLDLCIEAFTDTDFPSVTLDSLETLRLTIESSGLGIYLAISEKWSLPSLRNVILTEKMPLPVELDTAQREKFFAKFGPVLKYLNMRPQAMPMFLVPTFAIDVQRLLNLCPALEHLAISPMCIRGWPVALSHPTIKWVDVWDSGDPRNTLFEQDSEYFPASLPSLQRLRRLDGRTAGLPPHTDWPSVLPPWMQLTDTNQEYHYSGLIVRQTPTLLYRVDVTDIDWNDAVDAAGTEYDSSEDSSYVPPEDSDDSFDSDEERQEIDYDTGFLFSNEGA